MVRYIQKYINFFRNLNLLTRVNISLAQLWRLSTGKQARGTVTLWKRSFGFDDAFWFLHGLREIFVDQVYLFSSKSDSPRIIDCGSNIGLSLIYFKRLYPGARITAFEPAPEVFTILCRNMRSFGYQDIELINKAVWINNDLVPFFAPGSVGGRIDGSLENEAQKLAAQRLRDLLHERIDFLKIDIEGAEDHILEDIGDMLPCVENIFIEYHSQECREQKLDSMLRILKNAGFRYYMKEAWNNQPHPFVNKRTNLFDLQLNIFGYRV